MAFPPRTPRQPHPSSDRAAVLHQGRHPPAPTLASTRAAWLQESRAWANSKPLSAGQQAAWQREEAAWHQRAAAASGSDRAAVLSGPRYPDAFGRVPGTSRYYVALFGQWNEMYFEVDTAYLLVQAHELADSLSLWYEASEFVAEVSLKVDAGIQGRVEGMVWGLKGKADLNVVKLDLFEVKANLSDPLDGDSYGIDYAGKDGKTRITNSLAAQVEVPWLPKTPWGKLGLGGNVEQSQWIDANMASSGATKDWGVYAIIPVAQSKSMKNMSDRIKANPNTQMAKGPGISTKQGKQKDFYGLNVDLGAAALIGVNIKAKVGLK